MRKFNVTVNGTVYEVEIEEVSSGETEASAPAAKIPAAPAAKIPAAKVSVGAEGSVRVTAPMPGSILDVSTSVGKTVKKGELLCMLEAMKMENEIFAPADGTVASVHVQKGSTVKSGDLLFTLK